jgi:hypothetical protein
MDLGCYPGPRIELAGDAVDAWEVGQPVCIRGTRFFRTGEVLTHLNELVDAWLTWLSSGSGEFFWLWRFFCVIRV